jgi:tryptophan halogenase
MRCMSACPRARARSTASGARRGGHIAGLRLGDGSRDQADLYVDCTGPAALLRRALDDAFEDWSDDCSLRPLLFADAATRPSRPRSTGPSPCRPAGAGNLRAAIASHGLVYASAELGDSRRARVLLVAARSRRPQRR